MATFSQLMSAHRRSGKSYASAASTATIQKTISAIDPRQIFDREGVITALLPFLKSYQPRVSKQNDSNGLALRNEMRGVRSEIKNMSNELKNVTRISTITAANAQIMAKNTIGIPMMTRDINVMRQNIQKLVKLQGGTPTSSADKDFLKAKEREAAYEIQFNKSQPLETSPTQIQNVEQQKTFLSSIKDFFKSNLLISGIVGAVVGAISLYFTSDKFKNSVDTMINDFGKFVFGSEGWANIKTSLQQTVDEISNSFRTLTDNLKTELSKIPQMIVESFLDIDLEDLILSKLGIGAGTLAAAGTAYSIYRKRKTLKKIEKAAEKGVAKGLENKVLSEATEEAVEKGVSSTAKRAGVGAAGMVGTKLLNPKVSALLQKPSNVPTSSRWAKFLKFVERKSPKLLAQLTARASASTALASIPFAGWIASLIGWGFTLYTAYELVNLWLEFNDVEPENENSSPSIVKKSMDSILPDFSVQTQNNTSPQKIDSNLPQPTSNVERKVDTLSSGLSLSDEDWLKKIRMAEAGATDPYNSMNQGTSGNKIVGSGNSSEIINKKLTDMTIGEIMERQQKSLVDKSRIFAAGAYQIIPSTLKNLVSMGIVDVNDKFNEETQDKLGRALFEARKKISASKGTILQNELAKEWASIPLASDIVDSKGNIHQAGSSYYDKIGGNKASMIFSEAAKNLVLDLEDETKSNITINNDNSQTIVNNTGSQSNPVTDMVQSIVDFDLMKELIGFSIEK